MPTDSNQHQAPPDRRTTEARNVHNALVAAERELVHKDLEIYRLEEQLQKLQRERDDFEQRLHDYQTGRL